MGGWIHGWAGVWVPWSTFAVNALGSLLIGLSVGYMEGVPASPELRATVTVGFRGAFTTFSTCAYESVVLLREGEWTRGGALLAGEPRRGPRGGGGGARTRRDAPAGEGVTDR